MEVLDTHGKDRHIFRLLCKMHLKYTYESVLNIGSLPYLKLLLILIGTVLKFLTQIWQKIAIKCRKWQKYKILSESCSRKEYISSLDSFSFKLRITV